MTATAYPPAGIWDMSAEEYHKHPALSSSGARKLLPPSCPALFKYERKHPTPPTDAMVFGTAVHTFVLGVGQKVVEVEARDWKTKAAQERRVEIQGEGHIALLSKDINRAKDMAAAVRQHKLAAHLLREGAGLPERALFWTDPETGVDCRALLDWLPTRGRVAADLKTCESAAPAKVEKAVWDFGYHVQAAHYLDGMRVLGIAEKPAMAFVFVDKNPPHLVNVVQLNPLALEAGAHYARQARLIFAECQQSGVWPGWGEDSIQLIELPAYAQNQYFQEVGK